MSEMAPEYRLAACRWNGRGNPRTIPNRHSTECYNPDDCPGCLPCRHDHCRLCQTAHTPGTCPECLAETREALREIARMCGALPAEVEHRGIDGEAMMLLGPVADPERRQHTEASYLSGRLPEDWFEATHGKDCPRDANEACLGCAGSELHPLTILGYWDIVWRAELEHDEPLGRVTIGGSVNYLDLNLTYMGDYPHTRFDAFATDIRRCRNHLEGVLHDGEQRETGAPCMTCHKPLERVWGADIKGDGWKCPRCKTESTDAQYRFAVMHLHREEAEWLTDRDMQIRTGVKAGTVRVWARRALVRKKQDQGRVVYFVADVEAKMAGEESA